VELKKAFVQEMEAVVHLDETGFLVAVIEQAKKSLELIKARDVKLAKKNVQYSSYQCQQQNNYHF